MLPTTAGQNELLPLNSAKPGAATHVELKHKSLGQMRSIKQITAQSPYSSTASKGALGADGDSGYLAQQNQDLVHTQNNLRHQLQE